MDGLVVILATAGRTDLLGRTLSSLAACERPAAYRETIVVENGGQQGAQQVVEQFGASLNARYLYVPRGNKSFALNCALEMIGDELIFFTDDDVRLDRGVLAAYAKRGGQFPNGRFFGGPTSVDYEQEPPTWLKRYLPASAVGWEWNEPGDAVHTASFLGFNWAAYARDIRAAGGFDPNRGPGSPTGSTGQESDMQRRLLARGLVGCYVPEARVWHYIPVDRCTPAWAIERNYRHGVEHGRRHAGDKPAVGGVPLWVMRRRVQLGLRSALSALAGGAEARFKAAHRRSHLRGILEGMRQARQQERPTALRVVTQGS
jgi:GT2 family glycosyltransferase